MPTEKWCASCGRRITWRKKWERDWDRVKFCSKSCRRQGVSEADLHLEAAILELLEARSGGSTICPSEAARRVDPDGWRDRMDAARRAARRLVADGRAEVLQRGRVVDPSTAKGPIRIRRA